MSRLTRALITGASAGIGAAFARRLAGDGVDLVLVARRRDRLDALAREFRAAHGVDVEVLAADLETEAGVAAVEARLAADPPVDMLVNNAGFGVYGPFAETDLQATQAMLQLNVIVLTRLAHVAARAMLARGAGTIVNVASGTAFVLQPLYQSYSGTKAYVLHFSRALALDLGPKGVRVQCLVPGLVESEFAQRSGHDFSRVPPERVMQADDLVAASMAGLALGETVTIPSLPDYADYTAFEAAQAKVGQNVSRDRPAERYR